MLRIYFLFINYEKTNLIAKKDQNLRYTILQYEETECAAQHEGVRHKRMADDQESFLK